MSVTQVTSGNLKRYRWRSTLGSVDETSPIHSLFSERLPALRLTAMEPLGDSLRLSGGFLTWGDTLPGGPS